MEEYGVVYTCPEKYKWLVTNDSAFQKGAQYKDDMIGCLYADELQTLNYIRSYSGMFNAFIDIGAHVGYYTIRLAKYFKKIYAVEPNEKIASTLLINLALNDIKNVMHLSFALGKEKAEGTILQRGGCSQLVELGRPNSPIFADLNGFGTVEQKVTIRPLDEVILSDDSFIVKMDTEGFEPIILEGAANTIKKKSLWLIEHHEKVYNLPNQVEKITKIMVDAGHTLIGKLEQDTREKLIFSNIIKGE